MQVTVEAVLRIRWFVATTQLPRSRRQSRRETGGNQQVTVKHIHQQVNVTEAGKPWSRATK
jgi:hypothetical protein